MAAWQLVGRVTPGGTSERTAPDSGPSEERGHRQDEQDDAADGELGHRASEPARGRPPARLEAREQRTPCLQIPQQRVREGSETGPHQGGHDRQRQSRAHAPADEADACRQHH
jgi:hypothetical protein